MPDYAEAAEDKGWVRKGAKWHHKAHPGVEKYNAKQIWDEYPEVRTRPLSATPPEPKPVEAPKPVDEPAVAVKRGPGRPPKDAA